MIRITKVPDIETERLYLRKWKKEDAKDLYDYASNPKVGPRAGWKPHESVEESLEIIKSVFLKNTVWAMVYKESGKVIGSIGFEHKWLKGGEEVEELGYAMAEEFWDKGLMTEAAAEVIECAFEHMRARNLLLTAFPENEPSQRVALKCGFSPDNELDMSFKDTDGREKSVLCYRMNKEQYGSFKEKAQKQPKGKANKAGEE